jgi:hypothetical protein
MVEMPEGWQALVPWLEQLMEESLGKGGKGIVVFDNQSLNTSAPGYRKGGLLRVRVVEEETLTGADQQFVLCQLSLASKEPQNRLASLTASFLGWQLSMALYGYLHQIPFVGQPAVENYKARARALRTQPDPLLVSSDWRPALREGNLMLLAPQATPWPGGSQHGCSVASAFASVLQQALTSEQTGQHPQGIALGYLDVTVNGEASANVLAALRGHLHTIGNELSGIPVKLRHAPAAYHSTEQSEMDGPPYLISLRLVARRTETSLLGSYSPTFLHAQAVSTWQAMLEAGRSCLMLIIDGTLDDALEPLATLLAKVESLLRQT